MSRNFTRERLEIKSRMVEIDSIMMDRLEEMIQNVCIWTTEEFNYHDDMIENLENEWQELKETLQKL